MSAFKPLLQAKVLLFIIVVLIFLAYLGYRAFGGPRVVAASEEATLALLSPEASRQRYVLEEKTARLFASGEEVYKAVCASCHAVGSLNSPKFGDRAAWGPRIAKGYGALLKTATNGLNQMPPRGGNPSLSDYDLGRAIVFMARAVGANFAEPKPPQGEGKAADKTGGK